MFVCSLKFMHYGDSDGVRNVSLQTKPLFDENAIM